MDRPIFPVILCGGSGTRLWPRSRTSKPKPFLPLVGGESLFQQALDRCRADDFAPPVLVTGAAHRSLIEGQAGLDDGASIIVEPEARQTAASIALAALRMDPADIMLVCPSDHHIEDIAAFRSAVLQAAELASDGWLVCLGVRPLRPETRFGYLRRGEAIGPAGFRVDRFVEKPEAEQAARLLSDGDHLWNGGIFVMRAGDYLAELRKARPQIAAQAEQAVREGEAKGRAFLPERISFLAIQPESVDYAVMENSDRIAMVVADMAWSDVGDWRAVRELRERDSAGNSCRGPVRLLDCSDVLVETDGPKVHAIGLQDVVIIVDGNDILVADSASSARIAELRRRQGT